MKTGIAFLCVAVVGVALGLWIQNMRWEEKVRNAPRESDTVWTPYSVPAEPETLWLPGKVVADESLEFSVDSLLAVVTNKDSLIRALSRSYTASRELEVVSETDTLRANAKLTAVPFRRSIGLTLSDARFSGRSPLVTTSMLIEPPRTPVWLSYAQNGLMLTGGYFIAKEDALGAVSCIGVALLIEAFK